MHRILLLSVLIACAATRAAEPGATTTTTQPAPPEPVAAVTFIGGYRVRSPRNLITGVWSDGTVIASADRETGGPPYHAAKVEPERVTALLKALDALKFFTDPDLRARANRYPPDASHTGVGAVFGEQRQRLALWRAPATQPADADKFLQVFLHARRLIDDLAPAEGKPVNEVDPRVYDLGRPLRKR
jgi:hypothetical protein